MRQVILITGASSGFGALAARALAQQGRGLVLWVSSSSARGGTPPYLSPYFAAKAAMDSLAVSSWPTVCAARCTGASGWRIC